MPNLNKDLINDTLSVDLTSTQTLSNKTLTTPIINGPTITDTGQTPVIHGIYLPEPHVIYFEGSTADGFETILTVVDPTADRTVSLPDASGTVALSGTIALGTDTTGNYVATIAGTANEIAVSGSGSESAAVTISLPANVTISNNLVVTGDLTVSGNTTTLNTANLNVEDNFIMLNSGETGSPTLNAGIEVERGTSTNVLISWNETTDKWQFTNDGSTYDNIAGTASPTFTGTITGSPAAGTTATATSGIGYMGLPQNSTTTGAYGVVAADAGLHIYSTATRTVTIPANSNVAMPVGTTLVFIAGTGATVTIAITTDTMYLAGIGSTGSRTLAALGMATAVKIASTTWIISGNGLT